MYETSSHKCPPYGGKSGGTTLLKRVRDMRYIDLIVHLNLSLACFFVYYNKEPRHE